MEWGDTHPPRLAEIYAIIPPAFSSVSEAQNCLEFYRYLYRLSRITQADTMLGGPADSDIRKGYVRPYMDALRRWNIAFSAFLNHKGNSLTDLERQTACIVRMHQLLNQISLNVSARRLPDDEQMVWDNYCSVFNEVVELAESILSTWEPDKLLNNSSSKRKPSFSLDLAAVGPLYDTARRCRDPTIRRKAIDILHTFRRREGVWDSGLAALVAEQIVAIEEDGVAAQSCHDVPGWQRIFNARPIFDMENKKCYFQYERKASATRAVTVQMQEILMWK